jgi:hypothetical protein
MHEYGIGREPDMFLAKRFYDLCATMSRDGYIVASLSLGKWWLIHYMELYLGWGNSTSAYFPQSPPPPSPSSSGASTAEEGSSNQDLTPEAGSDEYSEEVLDLEFDMLVENLVITCLILIILILVIACA